MGYIGDGLNPRGPEYAAIARVAAAAQRTEQSMDDMLALAMAPDETTRMQVAGEINARRRREAIAAGRGRVVKWCVLAVMAAFCVLVYQLGDDHSSIFRAYTAFMSSHASQGAHSGNAPVNAEGARE